MKIKSVLNLIEVKTLVAGLFPVLLGSVYSLYTYRNVNVYFMICLTIAIALVQAATNMFNDYKDFKSGADGKDKEDEKILVSGEINTKQVSTLIVVFLTIALLIGIILASQTSWFILLVAVVGALVAYLYSSGPMPISHTPFGEMASGITMGIGITATVVYIQSNQFVWQNVGMAVPTAVYIGYIMFTNNLCDREKDIKVGRLTLPGLLGFQTSKKIWLLCCFLLVMITLAFIYLGIYPVWNLIVLLILINYRSIYGMRNFTQDQFQKGKMMGVIGKIGAQYHILMIGGLLIAWLFEVI